MKIFNDPNIIFELMQVGWSRGQPVLCNRWAAQFQWNSSVSQDEREYIQGTMQDAFINRKRVEMLRELCGYVEDGSASSISFSQDDATRDWVCHRNGEIIATGRSFHEVLDMVTFAQVGVDIEA